MKDNKNIKISPLEAEVLENVSHLLSIHAFHSVNSFKESINTLLFRVILHPDQLSEDIEKALQDLQHITYFLNKLAEYEENKAK